MSTLVGRGYSRLVELALITLGLASIFWPSNGLRDDVLITSLWDLVALLYLLIRWRRVRRSRKGKDGGWQTALVGRRFGELFTVLASMVGIGAGLDISLNSGAPVGTELNELAKIVGVPAVILAWLILHFGYAERYAHVYFDDLPVRSMDFPGTERPGYVDFVYFAFTLGTSFAVSDVSVLTSRLRTHVLAHSVLSFFYNTAILGIAIGVISGK